MTIAVVGNFGTGWDGSICDELNIAMALEGLGHTVDRVQRGTEPQGEYDFVLIAQWGSYPSHFCRTLKAKLKCPIVYWAFDYHGGEAGWHLEMATEADLFLSKEVGNKAKYENAGAKFRWLSQDFAPDFLTMVHRPEKYDVVFTGSYIERATDRTEILQAIDKEFDLHVFSVTQDQWTKAGLKNSHPPIMDDGLTQLYAEAKVVVSIDWVTKCAGYWSDRNAQIMCCGGVCLFKYIPMSEVAFKDKVVYFNTKEEAITKIKELLEDGTSRDHYRKVGYEYASQYLTVTARVKDLLTIVKGELL